MPPGEGSPRETLASWCPASIKGQSSTEPLKRKSTQPTLNASGQLQPLALTTTCSMMCRRGRETAERECVSHTATAGDTHHRQHADTEREGDSCVCVCVCACVCACVCVCHWKCVCLRVL